MAGAKIAGFNGVILASPAYADPVAALGGQYLGFPDVAIPATPSGQITGTHTSAVTLSSAAYTNPVTVAATAKIAVGGNQSTGIVDDAAGNVWTIDNLGVVSAGYGIRLHRGGSVNNSGTIAGVGAAVYIAGGVGTVTNSGLIEYAQYGIRLAAGGTITNMAGARLNGNIDGVAIRHASGQVTNAATIFGGNDGIYLAKSGTVENAGTIGGGTNAVQFNGTESNRLIVLANSVFKGTVRANAAGTNTIELVSSANTGTLNGLGGQYLGFQTVTIDNGAQWTIGKASAAETIDNSGTVNGAVIGVQLDAGGKVINRIAGTISAASGAGVVWGATGAVYNYGSIVGGSAGIATDGGKVINGSGGMISSVNFGVWFGATGAVYNYGSIAGGQIGVELYTGGKITNAAGATITGTIDGIVVPWHTEPSTVINSGNIRANSVGVNVQSRSYVTNESGATISGSYEGIYLPFSGTVENAGTISGGSWSVNFGRSNYYGFNRLIVDGGAVFHGIVKAPGVGNTIELTAKDGSGTLNGLGSRYVGFPTVMIDSGAHWAIGAASVAETIDNSGTVSNAGNGIELDVGGVVSNAAQGTITAGNYGLWVKSNPGAVDNFGSIVASAVPGKQPIGVYLSAGGSITNEGGAYISGTFGVVMNGSGVVENDGTISGSYSSVSFRDSGVNRLILDGGSVLKRKVMANAAGANTIELSAKKGAGKLVGLGSHYVGFQTVTIDPGAVWTVKGTAAAFAATTIAGSPTNDTLDLTDLPYTKGDTAKLAGNVLEILDATSAVIESITLAPTVSLIGTKFRVSSDGAAGTPGTKVTISDPKLAYWEAPASGVWDVTSNWSGAVPNGATVAACIFQYAASPYTVRIAAGLSISLLSLTVDSASANLLLQGALTARKGLTLSAGSVTLEGGSLTGPVTTSLGTTISAVGTITGAVSSDGLVDVLAGGMLKITGAVGGWGALRIESGSSLELGAGAGLSIVFAAAASPAERLILDKPSGSFGTINGFAVGDTIDLKGVVVTSEKQFHDILKLYSGSTEVARLTIAGASNFAFASDKAGGTDITLAAGAGRAVASGAQLNLFTQFVAAGLDIRALDAGASDIHNVLDHNVMLAVRP